MLTVRLPAELEQRLEAVAHKVGRSKHDVALEAIVEEIEDLEDGFLALERLNSGDAEFYTLEEVRERQQAGQDSSAWCPWRSTHTDDT